MNTEPFKINNIVSVQVVPFSEIGTLVTPQYAGPDEYTTHWAVYERDDQGMVHWFADVADETPALMVGEMIAAFHGVPIEPQPWAAVRAEMDRRINLAFTVPKTPQPWANAGQDDCAAGLHSWIGEIGKLPADTPCAHCGELYGNPD